MSSGNCSCHLGGHPWNSGHWEVLLENINQIAFNKPSVIEGYRTAFESMWKGLHFTTKGTSIRSRSIPFSQICPMSNIAFTPNFITLSGTLLIAAPQTASASGTLSSWDTLGTWRIWSTCGMLRHLEHLGTSCTRGIWDTCSTRDTSGILCT